METPDLILKPSDKRAIEALLWALKPLTNLRSSIPLPYAITFLMVALDDGKSVNAYARAMGVNRFVMDRYVRNIGDRARNGGPGLGLVRIERHPTYSNRRQVFLSTKGLSLAKEIFAQVRRGERFLAEPFIKKNKMPPDKLHAVGQELGHPEP